MFMNTKLVFGNMEVNVKKHENGFLRMQNELNGFLPD